MKTFAHFAPNSTEVLDPRPAVDVDAYKNSFGGVAETTWVSHTFKEVPADTQHGATDNGDGEYTNPTKPPVTTGRDITEAEFIKLGYGIGIADKVDQALNEMPSLVRFLAQYTNNPGIKFADAQPGASTTITVAFARMKEKVGVTDEEITAFLTAWVIQYPAT